MHYTRLSAESRLEDVFNVPYTNEIEREFCKRMEATEQILK